MKESLQKYFGIGPPKTGTTSLYRAFKILGFNSKHCFTPKEYQKGIDDYQFVNDTPIHWYYQKLDRLYPGSKLIYTYRIIDDVLVSLENHMIRKRKLSGDNNPWKKESLKRLNLKKYPKPMYGDNFIKYSIPYYKKFYEKHFIEAKKYFKTKKKIYL